MKLNKFYLASFLIEALLTTKALTKAAYRPVVIWHSMGDSCCNPESIGKVVDALQQLLPDTLIYSLNISDSDNELIEIKNSFLGNVNEQVDYVCEKLHEDDLYPQLKDGFNALGFSQGGQFLRAYVERCNDPPVHNLITYGSQHNGISDIPGCYKDESGYCEKIKMLLNSNIYSSYIQSKVIPAQYFKDNDNYEEYIEKSLFLADINNERETKNPLYKENMLKLNKFVMAKFEEEDMVVPPTSAWFGWIDDLENPISLNETETYKNDWIGLQTMDKQNKLDFITVPGEHMEIDIDYLIENILHPYLDEEINRNDDDDDSVNEDADSEEIDSDIYDYLNNFIRIQH
jgi:palmitoyl-protein thioesterase